MSTTTAARWWDSLITQHCSPFVVIALGTFVVHQVAWLLFNTPYLLMADYDIGTKWKINKTATATGTSKRSGGGGGGGGGSSSENTSAQRWASFRMLLVAHVLQMLPLLVVSYPLLRWCGFTVRGAELPSLGRFCVHWLVINVVEDTGFYWVHRALHSKQLYWIHKRHHEFVDTYSLAGEIAHPLEFLFNFLLPIVAGPLGLALLHDGGFHISTFWLWIVFRELRSTDAHSGYDLPFHPLRLLWFCYGGAASHAVHHAHNGRNANFGGYLFWDALCGTTHSQSNKQHQQE
jgi:sterol desaturase/sphingolipid hydroxylase (fatty acid hydroxylase superfamily)